jgi:hypothetical protein
MTMNTCAFLLLAMAVAAQSAAVADQAVWLAGAQKKDDPRVLAFYEGMCTHWADQNGLTSEGREVYLAKCRADAPSVFSVGYEEGDGGGGE